MSASGRVGWPVALVLGTLLCGAVRADDSGAQRARAHYAEAVKHYDLGEFEDTSSRMLVLARPENRAR